jgi:hypothetical protein
MSRWSLTVRGQTAYIRADKTSDGTQLYYLYKNGIEYAEIYYDTIPDDIKKYVLKWT